MKTYEIVYHCYAEAKRSQQVQKEFIQICAFGQNN